MNPCPDAKHLDALIADQLAEDIRHVVEDHVEECAECQAALDERFQGDTSVDRNADTSNQAESGNGDLRTEFVDRLVRGVCRDVDIAENSSRGEGLLPAEAQPVELLAGSPADAETSRLLAGRYQVVGEIARGGMGVVLRVVDVDVQRNLAVKVMLGPSGDEQTERFVEEARITGQLQHPGIPPVHEIGRLADGLPFFSMKLIEGRTLVELMRDRDKPQDNLPSLLKIFEQIAQTVGYAHSQGVIHRDLKPSNIMVGAFGEVQVMDWGLGKRLVSSEGHGGPIRQRPGSLLPVPAAGGSTNNLIGSLDETIGKDAATPDPDRLTQAGQVMGTPAYMPPEQARGKIDSLDERSDVFGLGAILCFMMTGHPPYKADDARDALRHAQRGDLTQCRQRLNACGADDELVELATQCLADDARQRPKNAGEVAQRVTAYLVSVQRRLEQAEIERATAQANAVAERKRRRTSMALATSLLVLIVSGSAAFIWYQREQTLADARKTKTENEIVKALDEATDIREELLGTLQNERDTALALHNNPAMWEGRLDAACSLVERAEALSATAGLTLAEDQLAGISALNTALAADRRDQQQARRLESIRLDATTVAEDTIYLAAVIPNYKAEFRLAGLNVEQGDPGELATRIRESNIRWQWVATLDSWANSESDDNLAERLLAIARAVDPDPSWRDRFRSLPVRSDLKLLKQLAADPLAEDQSPALVAALAVRIHKLGGDPIPLLERALLRHPNDFWLHLQFGMAAKDPQIRAGCYRAALALRPTSVVAYNNLGLAVGGEDAIKAYRMAIEIEPMFAPAYVNLGHALIKQNKLEEAVVAFRRVNEIAPNWALAYSSLGGALAKQEKFDKAIVAFGQAAKIDPNDAGTIYNMGVVYRSQNDPDRAMSAFRRAIEVDPEYAQAYSDLGNILKSQDKIDEAMAAYRKAIEIDSKYAPAYVNLGAVLEDPDEAIAIYRKALEIDPSLAIVYVNLGFVFKKQNKPNETIAAYRKAIEIDPEFTIAHFRLGRVLQEQSRHDEAKAAYRKAIEIDPRHAEAYAWLSTVFNVQRKFDEAIAASQKSIAIDPNQADPYFNLGVALQARGQLDDAIAAYRKAIEINPGFASAYSNLGNILRGQGLLEEATEAYSKAVEIDPTLAVSWLNLASALRSNGRLNESLKAFQQGHTRGSRKAGWRHPSAQWLKEAERLVELDAKLPAILRGEVKPANSEEKLELARHCQLYKKQFVAAAQFYADVLDDPETPAKQAATYRYNAARAAVLAASGTGVEAGQTDGRERAVWRGQALKRLKAQLDLFSASIDQQPELGPPVAKLVKQWQVDKDLASIREQESLANLPSTEKADWLQFWSAVEIFLEPLETERK